MKVIVFGATGSVGRLAVERLLADGHEVTAFARRPEALEITTFLTVHGSYVQAPRCTPSAVEATSKTAHHIALAKSAIFHRQLHM